MKYHVTYDKTKNIVKYLAQNARGPDHIFEVYPYKLYTGLII